MAAVSLCIRQSSRLVSELGSRRVCRQISPVICKKADLICYVGGWHLIKEGWSCLEFLITLLLKQNLSWVSLAPTLALLKGLADEGKDIQMNFFHRSREVRRHAKYDGRNTVTLIPGDGIGPEIFTAVQDIFRYIGVPVDFEECNHLSDTLKDVVTSVKRNGVAMKGNIFTPSDKPTFESLNSELCRQLELFANVVRCKSIPGIPVRHGDLDLVMIIEKTRESSHIFEPPENGDWVIKRLKFMKKIAKYAFDFAVKHGRKKVTAVHKANIIEVSKDYPDIEYNSMMINNCCMQLVSNPQQFDVMVMLNLYGNIVSNIGASLVGGPGIVPGENIGGDYAVFESGSRHTGGDIEGLNIANPMSLLFASTLMLEHLGWNAYGDLIHSAILRVVEKGVKTADVGGEHSTTDFLECLKEEIGQMVIVGGME